MRSQLVLLTAPLLLLLASACAPASAPAPPTGGSSSSGGGAGGQQVTLKAADALTFDPTTIAAKAGQPLQVTVQNGGVLVHDFTVQEGLSAPAAVLVDGGKSGSVAMTFASPGSYKFFCAQPGHDAAGMHGTIVVQ